MVDVDTTGAEALRQAITLLTRRKHHLRRQPSRPRPSSSWLEQYDLMELVDPGRFYPTNRHAAAAFRAGEAA